MVLAAIPADSGYFAGRREAMRTNAGPERHRGNHRYSTEFTNARIIVLTTCSGDVQVLRALKAGARAYILKGHVHRELLDTIRAVHAGQKRIPPEVAAALADHAVEDALSSREIDVLRLIATGNANKEIAWKLSIAEETVKSHVTNILAKLGANDRTHAVTLALKRGIAHLSLRQEWDSPIPVSSVSILLRIAYTRDGTLVQRLFSGFADGLPGTGLLPMRLLTTL